MPTPKWVTWQPLLCPPSPPRPPPRGHHANPPPQGLPGTDSLSGPGPSGPAGVEGGGDGGGPLRHLKGGAVSAWCQRPAGRPSNASSPRPQQVFSPASADTQTEVREARGFSTVMKLGLQPSKSAPLGLPKSPAHASVPSLGPRSRDTVPEQAARPLACKLAEQGPGQAPGLSLPFQP